jgi:hypothetical protein
MARSTDEIQAGAVQTGLAIVSTAAAVDRFVATRRAGLPEDAGHVERLEAPRRAA